MGARNIPLKSSEGSVESLVTTQTEPCSPWSNSCEVAIKEVKLAVGRDLHRSKHPKVQWNECMEIQEYIGSFTIHDIFSLTGETPETLVLGKTPDINEFASFK